MLKYLFKLNNLVVVDSIAELNSSSDIILTNCFHSYLDDVKGKVLLETVIEVTFN